MLVVFCVFISTTFYSQEIKVPNLIFSDLEPEWIYMSKDTNWFSDTQPEFSSPYSGKNLITSIIEGDHVYFQEVSTAPSPYLGPDGFNIIKINIDSGEKVWSLYHNHFNGTSFREAYSTFPNGLFLNEDNNLAIYGLVDLDSIDTSFPRFSYYGAPILHEIDEITGQIVNTSINQDTLHSLDYAAGSLSYALGNTSSGLVRVRLGFELDSPFNQPKDFVKITPISENLDILIDESMIVYSDSIMASPEFIPFQQSVAVSGDTLVIFSGTEIVEPLDVDTTKVPYHANLKWIDLKNSQIVRQVDISNHIPKLSLLPSVRNRLEIIDDNIILTRGITGDVNVEQDSYTWLLWYSQDGELIGHIPHFFNPDREYQSLKAIALKGEKLILAAVFNESGVMGYDIIQVDRNTLEYSFDNSIEIDNNLDSLRIRVMINSHLTEDDELIFGTLIRKESETQINNDFSTYFCFDLSDFLSSSEDIPDRTEHHVVLYPNPCLDELNISGVNYSNYFIADQTGLLMSKGKIIDNSIDVKDLPSGMYVLTVEANSKYLTKYFIKI